MPIFVTRILVVRLLLFMTVCTSIKGFSQRPTRQTVDAVLNNQPFFSIHQDNYLVTGIPTNRRIDRNSADVKYQISFRQVIARNGLPWGSYLYLTYTQKTFWDIYRKSLPFEDVNFHPALSLGKIVYNDRDELRGIAAISLEHESNGRDSIQSRTWNRLSLGYFTLLDYRTVIGTKVWLPWGYSDGNEDYLEYVGLGEVRLSHELARDKLYLNLMLRKGLNFEGKGVVRSRIYYTPFRKNPSNQYLMLEWYLGQAESMLEYEQSRSMLRIGYVVRSNEFRLFRAGG